MFITSMTLVSQSFDPIFFTIKWSIVRIRGNIDLGYEIFFYHIMPLFSMKFEMIPFVPSSTHLVAHLLKILSMTKVVINEFDKGRQHAWA